MKLTGQSSLDIVLMYFHANDEELSAALAGVDFETMLQSAKEEAAK
jgi:hypothetical protein